MNSTQKIHQQELEILQPENKRIIPITTHVLNEIRIIGCEAFVSGSQFFGYNSEKSDIDIIIKIPAGECVYGTLIREYMEEFINKHFSDMEFNIVSINDEEFKGDGYSADSVLCTSNRKDIKNFHFICYYENDYDDMKTDHIRIKKMLMKNFHLQLFIRHLYDMGKGDLKGSKVFRILNRISIGF